MTFAHGRIKRGLYLHDAIIARADHHLATNTAVRTGRACPFLRDAEIQNALVFECAAGTGIHTRATSDTGALAQCRPGVRDNSRRIPAVPNFPNELALEFIANPDTTKAGDALRHVHMN